MLYWNALPLRSCALDLPYLSPQHDTYIIYNVRAREVGASFPEGGRVSLYSSVVCSTIGRSVKQ